MKISIQCDSIKDLAIISGIEGVFCTSIPLNSFQNLPLLLQITTKNCQIDICLDFFCFPQVLFLCSFDLTNKKLMYIIEQSSFLIFLTLDSTAKDKKHMSRTQTSQQSRQKKILSYFCVAKSISGPQVGSEWLGEKRTD